MPPVHPQNDAETAEPDALGGQAIVAPPSNVSMRGRVARGASIIALFTLGSRIMGFIRDQVIVHVYGASRVTDVFWIAFTIPNVMRRLVAEGALTVTFVAQYKDLAERSPEAARRFYREIFGLALVVLSALVAFGMIFSEALVWAFAAGLSDEPEAFALGVTMTRFLFPYVFFVSLVALCMGVLNAHDKFAAPAAAPILLNISFIACAVLLYDVLDVPIFALVIGVVLGGVLQLLLQIPALWQAGLLVWPRVTFSPEVKRFCMLLLPQLLGLAVYQLNVIVLRQFASHLPAGQMTHYYNADRLIQFAYGIFAVAIAQAALVSMSEQRAAGKYDELFATWRFSVRLTSFVTTPAALGLIAVALPVCASFYFHGAYAYADVQSTAWCVVAFAPGLMAQGAVRSTVQIYFAMLDTKTPVIASAVSFAAVLGFGFLFFDYEIVGLAAALSVASWVQLAVLIGLLVAKRRGQNEAGEAMRTAKLGLLQLVRAMFVQFLLAVLAVVPAYFITAQGDWPRGLTLANVALLAVGVGVSIVIYSAGAWALRMDEIAGVVGKLRRRLGR